VSTKAGVVVACLAATLVVTGALVGAAEFSTAFGVGFGLVIASVVAAVIEIGIGGAILVPVAIVPACAAATRRGDRGRAYLRHNRLASSCIVVGGEGFVGPRKRRTTGWDTHCCC